MTGELEKYLDNNRRMIAYWARESNGAQNYSGEGRMRLLIFVTLLAVAASAAAQSSADRRMQHETELYQSAMAGCERAHQREMAAATSTTRYHIPRAAEYANNHYERCRNWAQERYEKARRRLYGRN
jgi:hypothetical protein